MAVIDAGAVRSVVVLRALGLGDLCTAVPALRALRRAYPQAELVLAAPAWQEPLARLAGVDRVRDTAPLTSLHRSLEGADLAVNLHGRGPQSTALLAATGPTHLVAFGHPDLVVDPVVDVAWRPDEHEVHRWCRLLSECGIPADPSDLELPRPPLAPTSGPLASIRRRLAGTVDLDEPHAPDVDLDAPPDAAVTGTAGGDTGTPGGGTGTHGATIRRRIGPERLAVVHPGAAAAGRRWPAERFGAVVADLVARGHLVALTGSEDEWHLCQRVLDAAGPVPADAVEVLAGRTSVLELAAVVADAALVVANDTGVAHLATAFGVPSVVLFGPTPPSEWGPPPGGPHRALWAGGRGDPHAAELHPGLDRIDVADVIAAVDDLTAGACV